MRRFGWIAALCALLVVTGLPAQAAPVAPAGRAAALPTPSCAGVWVGPEEVVASDAKRDSLGLKGWADTAFGVLRDPDGSYRFLAVAALVPGGALPQSIAVTRGTLADPVAGGVASMKGVIGVPAGYQYAGGGPVYRDPVSSPARRRSSPHVDHAADRGGAPAFQRETERAGLDHVAQSGMVLQLLHLERHQPAGGFYSELALGRFDPASGQTTYLGRIATPRVTYEQTSAKGWSADMGTPAFTVFGSYVYLHFPDYLTTPEGHYASTALSVARAPVADVLAAARSGGVVPWFKFHDGQWTSPAIGGASTDVRPGERGAWHDNVVRRTSGGSLLVQGVSPHEMVLATSSDGIRSWSTAVPLFRDPDKFNAYPTVVGTGADPSRVGLDFYVYYLQWEQVQQDWEHARMMRRLVRCTEGRSLGSVGLVRHAGTDGKHRVTTTPVRTPGTAPERGGLWYLRGASAPGTRAVYECRSAARGSFLSTDAGCEGDGNTIVSTQGWVDTTPSTGTTALYGCLLPAAKDSYVSIDPGCETAAATPQGLLGYARTTSKVVFSRFYDGREHWDTTGPVSAAYGLEHRYLLDGAAQPNTTALYSCSYETPGGVNHFVSVDSRCEGQRFGRQEGWIHNAAPAGRPSVPLYRCYWPGNYDHFLSTRADCEAVAGVKPEGLLGYAETL
jgi:hypothetical protein